MSLRGCIVALAKPAAFVASSAVGACPIADFENQYKSASAELFNFEFWSDVDERQARSALDQAIVKLATLRVEIDSSDCEDRASVRNLSRVVASALKRYTDHRDRMPNSYTEPGPR